jgi:hypothetical protein
LKTVVSLRFPGRASLAATMRRSRARQTICVFTLRRSFFAFAVRSWRGRG